MTKAKVDLTFRPDLYNKVQEVFSLTVRKVDISRTSPTDPHNIVQEFFGLTLMKVNVNETNPTEPHNNLQDVADARMRMAMVSLTNSTNPQNNVQEVDDAKLRAPTFSLTNFTDSQNNDQEIADPRMRAPSFSFTKPTDAHNNVQDVVGARTRMAKASLTNASDPHKNVQDVFGVKRRTATPNTTESLNKVKGGVGVRTRTSDVYQASQTDHYNNAQDVVSVRMRKANPINLTGPPKNVQGVVSLRTGPAEVNFINPSDPLTKVQEVVGERTMCCSGKRSEKKKMCSRFSLEERIFEMSSSANTNRADFKKKYIQLYMISKGGLGVVFTGLRRRDNFSVVLKYIPMKHVIWEKVTYNGKEFKVILEVALMLKAAGLPGAVGKSIAVSLLDWYILDQHLILIMERPPNCMDLHQYLQSRGGFLAEREAKMILKQLVDAAIDMESKGVFHRDIKCENVLVELVSGRQRVRLIDFGCGSFSSETPYSYLSGTLKYYPPEWFSIQTYWAYSTTVWQLGALFYCLLIGDFSTRRFVSNKIKISSSLSTEAKSMLEMCLNIEPYERATLRELQRHPMFTKLKHPHSRR